WVGIGIVSGMTSSYLIVAWPNKDGTVTLSQRQTTSYSEPKVTEYQNDLINMTTTTNGDGKLEVNFKRLVKVTTNTIPNNGDFVWAISNTPVDNSDPSATIKIHSKKGVIKMNLAEGDTSSNLT
ncbi:2601_t:CDS:2, partial [Dentiscutata erythropus]